jgi:hypothetical protein
MIITKIKRMKNRIRLLLLSVLLISSSQDNFATTSLPKELWIKIANDSCLTPEQRKTLRDTCKELREFLTENILLPIPITIQGFSNIDDRDRAQHKKYIQSNKTHCPTITLKGMHSIYKDFFSFLPDTVQRFNSGELTASSLAGALESLHHLRHLQIDSTCGTENDFIALSQQLSLLSRLGTLQIGGGPIHTAVIPNYNITQLSKIVKNIKTLISSVKNLKELYALNLSFLGRDFLYHGDEILVELVDFPQLKRLTLCKVFFDDPIKLDLLIHIIEKSQTINELSILASGLNSHILNSLISRLKNRYNNLKVIRDNTNNLIVTNLRDPLSDNLNRLDKLSIQPQL